MKEYLSGSGIRKETGEIKFEFSYQEWKTMSTTNRKIKMANLIDQVTIELYGKKSFNQAKLQKIMHLSSSLTFDEVMSLQICQHFTFIAHLLRQSTANARTIQNDISQRISRFQKIGISEFQKYEQTYHKMEQNDSNQGDQISEYANQLQEIARDQTAKYQTKFTKQNGMTESMSFGRKIKYK